jgi:hypothetical protein
MVVAGDRINVLLRGICDFRDGLEHPLRELAAIIDSPFFSRFLLLISTAIETLLRHAFRTEEYIQTLLKAQQLRTLGIVLDADRSAAARYQRCFDLCHEWFPVMPDHTSGDGVITDNGDGKRLGIWIMPDNVSPGDIETLLIGLVPESGKALWDRAVSSVAEARKNGSPCRECHLAKANLYTWLALQDPPGHSPGTAIRANILDANAAPAARFVRWFRRLYEL